MNRLAEIRATHQARTAAAIAGWAGTPSDRAAGLPDGYEVKTTRAHPGQDAAGAVAVACERSWWPRRAHDEPRLIGARWCWVVRL